MRKLLIIFVCLITLSATAAVKKQKLSVLYLGGQVDWENGSMGHINHFKNDAEFQQALSERMSAFEQLLKTYFTTVKTMPAKDWRPEMSDQYDVTIFDGKTAPIDSIKEMFYYNGGSRMVTHYVYIPENFSRPCVTIGTMGETLCRSIGIKNDWLCLCLDADAHGMNLNHQIFKGPFKTKLTLHKEPTPADAFHYAYFQDGHLPDSVMMWTVNTKGYMTTHDFAAGMVSRPWGYTDSPDCESISSGVCAKTLDAVALGRHANYFHWGFIGSPVYMTEEAKVIFANAVAYIAKFQGKPLVRKYNDRIATREYLKEVKYYCTREAWKESSKMNEEFYAELLAIGEKAREKKARGEELTDEEKEYVNFTKDMIPPTKSYAEELKGRNPDLFFYFGEDEQRYIQYYNDNAPYFYGGVGTYNLYVDSDAKAWGIANNDKRLIDKAILCLEQNQETDRARRVLKRYTLCEFQSPKQWREWYEKYKQNMFFTESGGWLFMPAESGAPGTDYSVLKRREEAAKKPQDATVGELSHENPFIVSARVDKGGTVGADLFIDIQLMPGYHIYKTVDQTDPYIPLKVTLDLPEGCRMVRQVYPMAKPFTKPGTTIYEGNVTLRHSLNVSQLPTTVKVTVECQCCDAHVCLPPFEKTFTLTIE